MVGFHKQPWYTSHTALTKSGASGLGSQSFLQPYSDLNFQGPNLTTCIGISHNCFVIVLLLQNFLQKLKLAMLFTVLQIFQLFSYLYM